MSTRPWTITPDHQKTMRILSRFVWYILGVSLVIFLISLCLRWLISPVDILDQLVMVFGLLLMSAFIGALVLLGLVDLFASLAKFLGTPVRILVAGLTVLAFSSVLLAANFPCRQSVTIGRFELTGYLFPGATYSLSGSLDKESIDGDFEGAIVTEFIDPTSRDVLYREERKIQQARPGVASSHSRSMAPVFLSEHFAYPKNAFATDRTVAFRVALSGQGKRFANGESSVSSWGPGGGVQTYSTREVVYSLSAGPTILPKSVGTERCSITRFTWHPAWYVEAAFITIWLVLASIVLVALLGYQRRIIVRT